MHPEAPTSGRKNLKPDFAPLPFCPRGFFGQCTGPASLCGIELAHEENGLYLEALMQLLFVCRAGRILEEDIELKPLWAAVRAMVPSGMSLMLLQHRAFVGTQNDSQFDRHP